MCSVQCVMLITNIYSPECRLQKCEPNIRNLSSIRARSPLIKRRMVRRFHGTLFDVRCGNCTRGCRWSVQHDHHRSTVLDHIKLFYSILLHRIWMQRLTCSYRWTKQLFQVCPVPSLFRFENTADHNDCYWTVLESNTAYTSQHLAGYERSFSPKVGI